MIYERTLTTALRKEIALSKIVVLTGMRQTGKTTLMRMIFDEVPTDNKIFLDLENPLNQKLFEELNYDNILYNLKEYGIKPNQKIYVFLDEIQVVPGITKAIKYLYDHYKIKFFLTGSSSFYLKNLFPESLAGRKITYELHPLSFEEFMIFNEVTRLPAKSFYEKAQNKNKTAYELRYKLFEEYIRFGGFPGVVIEKDNKKAVLGEIFQSYYEKEVRTLGHFRDIKQIRDLMLLMANRTGSKIDISKISVEIGLSRETVYSYLAFLEKTYFISLLAPFSGSLNGEVRGTQKIYLCDSGILNYIGKITEGVQFENAVFQNLRSHGKLNYYQKHKGPEIDFILNDSIAIEAKVHGTLKDIKKLGKVAESLKLKEYYMITKHYFQHPQSFPAMNL